jgi:hypothetical protein
MGMDSKMEPERSAWVAAGAMLLTLLLLRRRRAPAVGQRPGGPPNGLLRGIDGRNAGRAAR